MAKIIIISGSPSIKSRLNGILDHSFEALQKSGHQVQRISVRDLPAEDLLHARFDSTAIVEALKLVEEAEGVLVATPVYKAAYTGILKAFLDLLPQKGLERKTILPVAIGGTISHLLAIEYSLKPLLSVLGARNLLAGVYVLDNQVVWNESGNPVLSEDITERLNDSLQQFGQEVSSQAATTTNIKGV
ncbi:MAG: reductase [Bacilli bacterium]|nr:reductase [Bacilli bacterium]